jgi:hypothetical protein
MRDEPDHALHEASPLFVAARLLLVPNIPEGQYDFAAEIVSSSPQRLRAGPYRANPIEGQP